jgi:integrase
VLAYAGLRWGEVAALRVHRVDLARRRLEVDEANTEVGGHVVEGTTKNHERRSVPIPRFLADELAEHLVGKKPDDLVFTSPKGGVLRNTNFRSRFFDPAAEQAGLAGLTPHELRHTAASLAVQAGANVKVVQQMLGHASAAMTLDVYAGSSRTTSMRLRTASTRPSPVEMRTRCGLRAQNRPWRPRIMIGQMVLTRGSAAEPPIGIEPMTYALRGSPVGDGR